VKLRLQEFCTSIERLTWAKANGCPWGVPNSWALTNPCARAARGGHLEVLRWARERHCPWNEVTLLRRWGWALGAAAVGAGARLPVEPCNV
jgi:hypothetical protein